MAIYKRSKGPRGRWLYFKDGKMVSIGSIPQHILAEVDSDLKSTAPDATEIVLKYNECIFCKEHAKLSRLLNTQTLYLCNKDYYSKTIGQIAQQLREGLSDEKTKVR